MIATTNDIIVVDPRRKKHHVNRPPIKLNCPCGDTENIVLPKKMGVLVFNCSCKRQYQVKFGPEAGEVHQLI